MAMVLSRLIRCGCCVQAKATSRLRSDLHDQGCIHWNLSRASATFWGMNDLFDFCVPMVAAIFPSRGDPEDCSTNRRGVRCGPALSSRSCFRCDCGTRSFQDHFLPFLVLMQQATMTIVVAVVVEEEDTAAAIKLSILYLVSLLSCGFFPHRTLKKPARDNFSGRRNQ